MRKSLLELRDVFPSGQWVRLLGPLDQGLRYSSITTATKATLQDAHRDRELVSRRKKINLYLIVGAQRLLDLGYMKYWMNFALLWELEAISNRAHSLEYTKWPIIFEQQLMVRTRSH
jgi:hypothetical protein